MRILVATQLLDKTKRKGKSYHNPVYQMIDERDKLKFCQFLSNATEVEVRVTFPQDTTIDVCQYSGLYFQPGKEIRDNNRKWNPRVKIEEVLNRDI